MASKIFMNKQHALAFAKAVSGTVEKEPVSFNRPNGRPSGYVVSYDVANLPSKRDILYKEPQEVNRDFSRYTKVGLAMMSHFNGEGL